MSHKLEEKSYSLHFAVVSILAVLATSWAIWDEFETRRPWKQYQRQFNDIEYERVYAELEEAEKTVLEILTNKKLDPAVKDLDQLDELIEKKLNELRNSPEYLATESEIRALSLEIRELERVVKFTKSEAEELYYRWKHALHLGEDYQDYADKWQETQVLISEWMPQGIEKNQQSRDLRDRLKLIEAEIKDLIDLRDEIADYRDALKGRLDTIDGRLVEINQIVLPAFEKNKFGEAVARVDRCTSCHVAVERDGFQDLPEPFKTHPGDKDFLEIHNPEKMGCTPCHGGQGNALRSAFQAHGVKTIEADQKEYLHHWDEPLYEGDFINASCSVCHQTFEIEGADPWNKGRLLFSELGCHGCHLTEGYDEKDKIGPDLKRIGAKVNLEWLTGWIRDPKQYLEKTRMPDYRFSEEEILSITAYLVNNSENYQQPAVYPSGGSVQNGKELTEDLGCLGCHSIGNHKAGGYMSPLGYDLVPDLSKISSKTNSDWIFNWIKDPKAFRPTTKMPGLRLSDEEARDITAYLLTFGKAPETDTISTKINDGTLLDKGKKLIYDYGCYGCHEIKGFEQASRIAPPLSEFGIKDPHTELYFGDSYVDKHFRYEFGQNHETWKNWTFNKLKDPGVFVDEMAPTLMPSFNISDENAKALMVLLRSFTGHIAPEEYRRVLTDHEIKIEKGKNLVRTLNCVGCHEIYGKGGDILQFYENMALGPPKLDGEGDKVQGDWLFRFLKKPVTLRTWLKVRMPSFQLSDENTSAIVEYFKAQSDRNRLFSFFDHEQVTPGKYDAGRKLFGDQKSKEYNLSLKCGSCHPRGKELPEGNPADWGPDLSLAKERLDPDWIVDWLKNPQEVQEGTRMPNFFFDYDEWEGEIEIIELLPNPDYKIDALRDYMMTMKD